MFPLNLEAHDMPRDLNVWIINQYAIKADEAGGTRHHTLARLMQTHGIRSTLIAGTQVSRRHESIRRPPKAQVERLKDAIFVWLRVRPYSSNGLGRVVSMLGFMFSVVLRTMSNKRLGIPRPDVIIGSSPHLFGALGAWIVAKRYHVPFVLEVRDLWPRSFVSLLGVSKHHPLIAFLAQIEKFLYRHSSTIFSLLEGAYTHIESVAGTRVPPIVWVPNGVDIKSSPPAQPVRTGRDFIVTYAGTHGVVNNMVIAVKAARLLQDEGASTPSGGAFVFRFIGDGIAKRDMIEYAEANSLTNVEFSNSVRKAEVPRLLAEADALVLCAIDTDLYKFGISPNKLFDYFAAGRPIAFGLKTEFDPVADAGAGITHAPDNPAALVDAVKALASLDAAERQRMGSNGVKYVTDNHDMELIAKRMAETLVELGGSRTLPAQG